MARMDPTASFRENARVQIAALFRPSLAVPVAGVVASELALYLGHLDVSLWGHLLTLLFCVLGPLALGNDDLLQAFALVPLFRLVNLGMPVFVKLTLLWFPLVYAPLVPGMYQVARNNDVDLSFRPKLAVALLPVSVVLGAVLGHVEYAIIRPDALVRSLALSDLALITVVMVCFVGFVEEFVYRGVLQRLLEERVGRLGGLLVSSALFGLMHSAYHVPGELAFAAGIGLVFGLVYDATDSLATVTVIHGALNVFLFAVVPLQGMGLGLL